MAVISYCMVTMLLVVSVYSQRQNNNVERNDVTPTNADDDESVDADDSNVQTRSNEISDEDIAARLERLVLIISTAVFKKYLQIKVILD